MQLCEGMKCKKVDQTGDSPAQGCSEFVQAAARVENRS
jgi:hypothetical protein